VYFGFGRELKSPAATEAMVVRGYSVVQFAVRFVEFE